MKYDKYDKCYIVIVPNNKTKARRAVQKLQSLGADWRGNEPNCVTTGNVSAIWKDGNALYYSSGGKTREQVKQEAQVGDVEIFIDCDSEAEE